METLMWLRSDDGWVYIHGVASLGSAFVGLVVCGMMLDDQDLLTADKLAVEL